MKAICARCGKRKHLSPDGTCWSCAVAYRDEIIEESRPRLDVLDEVDREIQRALEKHGPTPFHSPHEAYGVLLEEVDELWDEIKADRGRTKSARKEAIQVAAMAIRYAAELT